MQKLSGAVGAAKLENPNEKDLNAPEDVRMIQILLNDSMHDLPHFRALSVDRKCGAKTIAAIEEFQRRYVPGIKVDGRIDPNGKTIAVLTAGKIRPFPAHVMAFINFASSAAKQVNRKWGVPASVLIAQAAHESGWGRHVKGNAYFGIKGKSPDGGSTSFATHEVVSGKVVSITDSFRAYKDFADAADDYGRYLKQNKLYKNCFFFTNDVSRFVDEIAKAGYATDPNYATKVKNIINKYRLTEYDN